MLLWRHKSVWRHLVCPKSQQQRFSSSSCTGKSPSFLSEPVFRALEIFKAFHGHLLVPELFQIPTDTSIVQTPQPEWSLAPEVLGMKLGMQVKLIRRKYKHKKLTQAQLQRLEQMEFAWVAKTVRFESFFLEGIRIHNQLFGHVDVTRKFIVPEHSPWPKHLHGYKLGVMVCNVRNFGRFASEVNEHREELNQLGFSWNIPEKHFTDKILPALETYYALHGDMNIKVKFIVPEGDPQWEKKLWGMQLGAALHKIRFNGTFQQYLEKYYDRLDRIGLVMRAKVYIHENEQSYQETMKYYRELGYEVDEEKF